MSAAASGVARETVAAGRDARRGRPHWLWRFLRFGLSISFLHALIAIQLLPVIGFFAAIYLVFPPILFYIAWDSARTAPSFALLALGPCLLLAAPVHALSREMRARLPRMLRWIVWVALAIWLPVAAGESLRWSLMQTHLALAQPECHGTSTLLDSLRARYGFGDLDEPRRPHAWMIDGGQSRLWSYNTLNFEPAPEWYGAREVLKRCRAGTLAVD